MECTQILFVFLPCKTLLAFLCVLVVEKNKYHSHSLFGTFRIYMSIEHMWILTLLLLLLFEDRFVTAQRWFCGKWFFVSLSNKVMIWFVYFTHYCFLLHKFGKLCVLFPIFIRNHTKYVRIMMNQNLYFYTNQSVWHKHILSVFHTISHSHNTNDVPIAIKNDRKMWCEMLSFMFVFWWM